MNEAVEKIRKDLGSDAIILDTKKVSTRGFLGLFKQVHFEVIAAIDEPAPSFKPIPSIPEEKKISPPPLSAETKPKMEATLPTAQEQGREPNQGTSLSEKGKQKEKDSPTQGDGEDPWQKMVLQEMKEMRSLIRTWVEGRNFPSSLPEDYKSLYTHLIEQEVEEELVIKLFIDLMENHGAPQSEAEARMRVKEKLIEWIRPRLTGGIKSSTRLVHIIGPTGVGKTTTIAKLASEYLLHRKKKVAFLTSDTYRIAAIDQLKTYSNILNIPMEVIFSPKDLPPALSRVSHYDLILMDTAGRNYRDRVYLNEMKELLTSSLPSETYLVLSLTTKFKDMKELVEEFLQLGIDHVIFTKLDETLTHGAIFNLAYHYPITLSYITNGQSVPDDLLFLTPERFADLLLGGEKS